MPVCLSCEESLWLSIGWLKMRHAYHLEPATLNGVRIRQVPDTFKLLRHVMRAVCVCPTKVLSQMRLSEGIPLKPVQILKHPARISIEQMSMRTK